MITECNDLMCRHEVTLRCHVVYYEKYCCSHAKLLFCYFIILYTNNTNTRKRNIDKINRQIITFW